MGPAEAGRPGPEEKRKGATRKTMISLGMTAALLGALLWCLIQVGRETFGGDPDDGDEPE